MIFLFRQKKIKLSSTEELAVIPEEPVEKNSFQGFGIHHQLSLVKKDNGKLSKPDKSNTLDNKKRSHEVTEPMPNETRYAFVTF